MHELSCDISYCTRR